MLSPCPHCDQQVVVDEQGQCPLCHGVIPALADQPADEAFSEDVDVITVETVSADDDPAGIDAANAAAADTGAVEVPNPYAAPRAAEAAVTAAVAQPLLIAPRQRPHPGIWGAIGLLVAVWIVQVIAAVVAVFLIVFLNLLDRPLPELARDPEALQRALLEGSSGAVFWLTASGSVLALGGLFALLYGRAVFDKLALRRFTSVQLLLVLLTVLPASVLAVQALVAFAQLMPRGVPLMPDLDFSGVGWPVMIVAICLFPGVAEELVFRGVMGRGLTARYGIARGILITSLLFGVAHLIPGQAFFAFLLVLLSHSIAVD